MHASADFTAGVIEGFFGTPWSWAARLSGADFLRDSGYRFYIYAPKADLFLRRRWQEPIPDQLLYELTNLRIRCQSCGILFGIGLTPFEIYRNYDAAARMSLRAKVLQINSIHADILCILFDDMRGDVGQLADTQARVTADACSWSNASRFIVCPTYYSFDPLLTRAFGSAPANYLRDFGRSIDPGVDVFWTGEKVISEGYSARHLADVEAELGRKPFIWDNHISNDSKTRTNHLYLDPSTPGWELPLDRASGIAINPMNQPHLSRISLCLYRRLLECPPDASRSGDFGTCRALCAAPFTQELLADGRVFQECGLARLEVQTRQALLERYARKKSNPYAHEVAAWLRGEYAFDPECPT